MIEGFSKLSREQKIQAAAALSSRPLEFTRQLLAHWHSDLSLQKIYAEFTENTVSNYYLPYCLAPNFLVNHREYIIPMVTEESSVVAAASAAAKYWHSRGGFTARVSKMLKPGHIHFYWTGNPDVLDSFITAIIPALTESAGNITKSMKERGGGIEGMKLKDLTSTLPFYYQVEVLFNTVDAMGANFINSCLEAISARLIEKAKEAGVSDNLDIVMSILSNYTPECMVRCTVRCSIDDLEEPGMPPALFARRFESAVKMADADTGRAVTHNKGIFNGTDAVIIATGNDFRAAEAAGHAWASRTGRYRSLSEISIDNGFFELSIGLPMSLGVTGGITNLHPLAQVSLQLLHDPDAASLMAIAASAGLANHFSAIRSLITTGIQKGHMKLHLVNILNQLDATEAEKEETIRHFQGRNVTYASVKEFLSGIKEKY